jgi:hypothetical protein
VGGDEGEGRAMESRKLLSLRPERCPPRAGAAIVAAVVLLVVATIPAVAARRDDAGTMKAVLAAQLASTRQGNALNKCLAASPHKNTPCTLREALKLANLNMRLIKSIRSAMDGTERVCVRTVALKEITYLKIWRQGMVLLRANKRKQARRLLISSGPLADSLEKMEKVCFPQAVPSP